MNDDQEHDPAEVRAWTVSQGLTSADDTSEVGPPEYRAYASWKALQARLAEIETVIKVRQEREAREAAIREANRWTPWKERRWARKWGQINGWTVGTRGRVSAALMQAYREANARTKTNPQGPDAVAGNAPPGEARM